MTNHPRSPRRHKFAVGQVVYWGNGFDRYVRVERLLPLHCEGGCFSYRVQAPSAEHVDALGAHYANYDFEVSRRPVSEEVLRPLTETEAGCRISGRAVAPGVGVSEETDTV